MKLMLVIGSIILPVAMFYSQRNVVKLTLIYNVIAIISILIFGNIASLSIYKVIVTKSVFMTTIHAVFLNPLFLITGTYIGVYIVYRVLRLSIEDYKDN